MYLKVTQAADAGRKLADITYVHGTRSTSLPPILKVEALLAAGNLLPLGIPMFSGELSNSHRNLNGENISVMVLSSRWHEGPKLFDCATNSLVSCTYAEQDHGYVSRMHFSMTDTIQRLRPEILREKLFEKTLKPFTWELFYADILRVRSIRSDASTLLDPFKKEIEAQLALPCHGHEAKKELQILLEAMKQPMAIQFDATDLELILSEKPFPILFGSTTSFAHEISHYESLVRGPQKLGEDVQLAFVPEPYLAEAGSLLAGKGVEVFSLEVLFYLELRNMVSGGWDEKMRLEGWSPFKRLSTTLQRDVLPLYAKLFPEHPKKRLGQPHYHRKGGDWAEYAAKVQSGEILARRIHGPTHAVRVALFGLALLNLGSRYLSEPSYDIVYAGLVFSLHDCGREGDGEDLWEPESAYFIRRFLQARGYSIDAINEAFFAILHKDPENKIFTSPLTEALHNADALDLPRLYKTPIASLD